MTAPTPEPGLTGEVLAAYRAGRKAGYVEAMSSLDEAAGVLAALKPSRSVDVARARAARHQYRSPARSAQEIRAGAFASWDLDDPQAAGTAAVAADTAEAPVAAPTAGEDSPAVELGAGEVPPGLWCVRPPREAAPGEWVAWFTSEAARYDAHAVQARAVGDVMGAVEAEVLAARARLDAADLTHQHSLASHSAGASLEAHALEPAGSETADELPVPSYDASPAEAFDLEMTA